MTGELAIARHGEAVCNVMGIVGGLRGCTGLTEGGRNQVRLLARRLGEQHRQRPYAGLLNSPLLRARQTADEVAERTGLSPVVVPGLGAPDYGDVDGEAWLPVRTAFGGYPRRHPDRSVAPGAETWNEFLARAGAALRAVLEAYPGQRVLVAGHRETVEAVHTLMLGLPPGWSTRAGFTTDYASLTVWQCRVDDWGHQTWRLSAYNDVAHLVQP